MYNAASPLTPADVSAASAVPGGLDVDNIQGDILVGMQKNAEIFQFFSIGANIEAFKQVLRGQLTARLTSTRLVIAREFQLRDAKSQPVEVDSAGDPVQLPIVGFNIAFTNLGIKKLTELVDLGDASFNAGAVGSGASLGDPLRADGQPNWNAEYLDGSIDGVLMITAGDENTARDELANLQGLLGSTVTFPANEVGAVRKGDQRGHEHFGFLDGVSQPAIDGLGIPFPGQRELSPGWFVFADGPKPAAPAQTPPSPAPPQPKLPWMLNGSFMVLRRLRQFVPEFESALAAEGERLGLDAELLGARMMGRWQSGAQVSDTPFQDEAELGSDPVRNNDFDFSDDPNQRACPYGAHIRKVNPREDLAQFGGQEATVDPHRIVRQGIPFGPEVTSQESEQKKTIEERGLLFVCYQTSIQQQFEFIQKSWANNTDFSPQTRPPAPNPAAVPPLPPSSPRGAPVVVGFDPIIGQNSAQVRLRETDEAFPNFPTGAVRSAFVQPQDAVVPEGTAYFFMPSISAILTTLSS